MKRFFLIASVLLLACAHVKAATVYGTNVLSSSAITGEKKVVFTPIDGDRASGPFLYSARSVSAAIGTSGGWSVSLVEGEYRVAVDSRTIGYIVVPSGSGSYSISEIGGEIVVMGSTNDVVKVMVDSLDTTAGYLTNKIEAGTNIVLTVSTNAGHRTLKINSSASASGSVESVAMTGDNVIYETAVTGSPVTTTGTLVPALKTQTANRVLAGPTTGSAATPTFRALVAADVPDLSATYQPLDADLTSIAGGVTGLVKGAGNGAGYSAAVSGTDYAPATSGTSILKGNGSGGFANASAGTDYVAPDADITSIAGGITGIVKGAGNGSGYSAAVSGTDYAPPATQVSLTHAGTVTLSFSPLMSEADLVLTGAVTFATSSLAAGKNYTIYGRNTQATNCTPTFPSWRWMVWAPTTITARKEFIITLASRGTVDTNVWAAFSEAP